MSEVLETLKTKLAEKLGIKPEKIDEEYKAILEAVRKEQPGIRPEDAKKIAERRLRIRFKRQLMSPAVTFEGMVLGAGALTDTMAGLRAQLRQKVQELGELEAFQQGLIDRNGNLLDTRERFSSGRANPRYGKPLPEHSWVRNIVGVAGPVGGKVRPFFMTANGEQAKIVPPLFVPVRFRVNNRTLPEEKKRYTLTSSVTTTWELAPDLKLPPIEAIIKQGFGEYFVPINRLEEYLERHKDEPRPFIVTEGDVLSLNLEPNVLTGSRTMMLDDESLDLYVEEGRPPAIVTFIPEHVKIDFAEASRVIVFGTLTRTKARDPVTGEVLLDVPGPVAINVYGVYAIPAFKIAPAGEVPKLEPAEDEPFVGEEW